MGRADVSKKEKRASGGLGLGSGTGSCTSVGGGGGGVGGGGGGGLGATGSSDIGGDSASTLETVLAIVGLSLVGVGAVTLLSRHYFPQLYADSV